MSHQSHVWGIPVVLVDIPIEGEPLPLYPCRNRLLIPNHTGGMVDWFCTLPMGHKCDHAAQVGPGPTHVTWKRDGSGFFRNAFLEVVSLQ